MYKSLPTLTRIRKLSKCNPNKIKFLENMYLYSYNRNLPYNKQISLKKYKKMGYPNPKK